MRQKKKIIILLLCLCLCLTAGTVFVVFGKSKNTGEIKTADNQKIVYGYLTSVLGNEISYTSVDESIVEAMLSQEQSEEDKEDTSDSKAEGEVGQRDSNDSSADNKEQQPDKMQGGGTPPDMSNGAPTDTSGNTPTDMGENAPTDTSGDTQPDMGENAPTDTSGNTPPDMSNGAPSEDNNGNAESVSENDMTDGGMQQNGMQTVGDSVTTLIPVGTVVHTTTDTETTFARLASGDLVKMLVETKENGEEVIVEMWMVQ